MKSYSQIFRNFFTLFLGLVSLVLQAQENYIITKNTEELYKFFEWNAQRIPLVSAHRGGPSEGFPENCLETFENVLQNTPAIIECDVMLTKDNVAIMMHDKTLERTTNGEGKVSEVTWEYVQGLYLKDNQGNLTEYKVPTLEELLIWAKGKTILSLDVKNNIPPEMLLDILAQNEAESYVVIITYSVEDALIYHQLAPDLMLSVSGKNIETVEEMISKGIPPKNMIAFTGVGEPKLEVIKWLHEKKISCILGTMWDLDEIAKKDEGEIYRELVEEGKVDILATDNPILAGEVLKELIPENSPKQRFFR